MSFPDIFHDEIRWILLKPDDLGKLAEYLLKNYNRDQPVTSESAEEEKPFTQDEAIKFLGKTRQTLSSWRRKGLIKAYRLGGRIYYKPSELVAALQKLE